MRGERGFTIIEVLVAVLLLATGGVALISAAASIPQVAEIGREDTRVSAAASSALESLRVRACLGPTDGWEGADYDVEWWQVRSLGDGVFELAVVVRSHSVRRAVVDSLGLVAIC